MSLRNVGRVLLPALALSLPVTARGGEAIPVYVGYVTQIHCNGKLFLSSVGNPQMIIWEAFPKELGCGVILQAKGEVGTTDILLKTSTGDFHLILEIRRSSQGVQPRDLEVVIGESKRIGEKR